MTTNENNPCTCTTPEYTIILNQQGPSGRQGEAGQDGFSPIVAVGTNTRDTYTLVITTADGVITTPNLISEPIPSGGIEGQVLTNTGQDNYGWAYLPQANPQSQGVVRLSTNEDFQPDGEGLVDDTTACTPQSVVNYVKSLDLRELLNAKDIENGISIGIDDVIPESGIYYKNTINLSVVPNGVGTDGFNLFATTEKYTNGILEGTRNDNILTEYNGITFVKLTAQEYTDLPNKKSTTMYILTDTNKVYLGTMELTGGGSSAQQSTFVNYPESSIVKMNALKSNTQVASGYPDAMKIVISNSTLTSYNIRFSYPASSLPNADGTGYTSSDSYYYNLNLTRGTSTGTTVATALLYFYNRNVYYTDSLDNLKSYVSGFDASKAIYIGSGSVASGQLQQLTSVPEYVINNFTGG